MFCVINDVMFFYLQKETFTVHNENGRYLNVRDPIRVLLKYKTTLYFESPMKPGPVSHFFRFLSRNEGVNGLEIELRRKGVIDLEELCCGETGSGHRHDGGDVDILIG